MEMLNGGIGLLSILVACALRPEQAAYAGFVFLLVPVVSLVRRHRRALEQELLPGPP